MIDKNLLDNAVRIRRNYLKVTNNLELYQKQAKELVEKLDSTIKEITDLKEELKNKGEDIEKDPILKKLTEILKETGDSGIVLEEMIKPINQKIETLANEEQELYRAIKEKHYDLTDEQIIEEVKNRLKQENLI